MRAGLVALAIGVACRGTPDEPPRAAGTPHARDAANASVVPKLPPSPDGVQELAALDQRIAIHAREPELEIMLLLERASIRGRLEDYTAALARSKAWIEHAPTDKAAWRTRAQVLSRVHEFADARAALAHVHAITTNPEEIAGLAATIDEATGVGAIAYREQMARDYPDPTTLTQWAATLATAGRYGEALAVMQQVPATLHDNAPELIAWILFQWGRIYEQKGELAVARDFYAAAHDRLPTVEAAVHLAQAIAATGGDPAPVVAKALAADRHPDLLALAGEITEARAAWERYVAALPEAFADHAARFYLGPGHDPRRALELARQNHANRDTAEARSLVVLAALAAGDPAAACAVVDPLREAARPEQFVAWRALSACGRTADADALARRLGIR